MAAVPSPRERAACSFCAVYHVVVLGTRPLDDRLGGVDVAAERGPAQVRDFFAQRKRDEAAFGRDLELGLARDDAVVESPLEDAARGGHADAVRLEARRDVLGREGVEVEGQVHADGRAVGAVPRKRRDVLHLLGLPVFFRCGCRRRRDDDVRWRDRGIGFRGRRRWGVGDVLHGGRIGSEARLLLEERAGVPAPDRLLGRRKRRRRRRKRRRRLRRGEERRDDSSLCGSSRRAATPRGPPVVLVANRFEDASRRGHEVRLAHQSVAELEEARDLREGEGIEGLVLVLDEEVRHARVVDRPVVSARQTRQREMELDRRAAVLVVGEAPRRQVGVRGVRQVADPRANGVRCVDSVDRDRDAEGLDVDAELVGGEAARHEHVDAVRRVGLVGRRPVSRRRHAPFGRWRPLGRVPVVAVVVARVSESVGVIGEQTRPAHTCLGLAQLERDDRRRGKRRARGVNFRVEGAPELTPVRDGGLGFRRAAHAERLAAVLRACQRHRCVLDAVGRPDRDDDVGLRLEPRVAQRQPRARKRGLRRRSR
mmetsp:Transcript_16219/g.65530  ORF Transcript_16219/g.65530 Transcript_16219/m.65530 type:complete len:539 (+) Transcript_16219:425-2041(+)